MTHKFNHDEDRRRRVIEKCDFVLLECGYYYVDLEPARGCLSASDLRIIADELDRINADWDKSITDYFVNNTKSPSCE